ncbi:hypothetical protein [Yersinia phage vB_YenM_P778]
MISYKPEVPTIIGRIVHSSEFREYRVHVEGNNPYYTTDRADARDTALNMMRERAELLGYDKKTVNYQLKPTRTATFSQNEAW